MRGPDELAGDGVLLRRRPGDERESDDGASYVVEVEGAVAGRVCLRWSHGGHSAELTWAVLPPFRGRGVAARAVAAAMDWAFAHGTLRVEARVEADDAASLRVAARVGLRREGLLRQHQVLDGRPRDMVLLARLAGDIDPAADALPTLAASFPRTCVAAGLVVRDPAGRVLLLQTSYKTDWEVPGGLVEPGEDLVAAAAREAMEELALVVRPGPLLALDTWPADGRSPDILLALLDGGTHAPGLVDRARFTDGEVVAAHWCDRGAVAERCGPRLSRRLLAVLDALDGGRLPGSPLLLRSGEPPSSDQGTRPRRARPGPRATVR